ncbi:MAG: hypothetical protein IJQ66_05555 [Clostridia bacterium]|nr:hypothetical protein [Clostridia bacterium]
MDFKCKTYACDEIITIDNVKELSEYLAVNSVKAFMRFSRVDFFFNLYDNLFRDIRYKNDYRYIFSSAYDIVMDAYCFLFSHLGKRLNDITKVSKYGVLKKMTILGGCMFILSKHIRQDLFTYNCKDIDICRKSELRINDIYDYSEEEWVKVDETIEKLELTESELKTLDCLISGKSLSETARTISCGVSTVFDRRNKLQKKYLKLINV